MSNCARPGCFKSGTNRCSTCLREPYCSGACQKADWKSHKSFCKIIKKLSHELQSYQEVHRLQLEIRQETPLSQHLPEDSPLPESFKMRELNSRVLAHLISYAEHQLGNRVPGKDYRQRGNGERIDNWRAEMEILIPICFDLVSKYMGQDSKEMEEWDMILPYYKKMLGLLKPWSIILDMNTTSKVNILVEFQIHKILMMSSFVYEHMAQIYILRNEFDLAETHCDRALHYARMYDGKGENSTNDLLLSALQTSTRLKLQQSNFADAFTFAEEAYNYVAIAYNPVHPEVQKAAVSLIECLTHKGDLFDAERFAQASLDSLIDPANRVDQNSEEVSIGYYQLGKVIHAQNGDLVKAERLARESLRIQYLIYGSNTPGVHVGNCIGLLANILISQGKRGSEPKELLERCLAYDIKYYGSNGANTAVAYMKLGEFYYKSASEILLLLDGRETYSNKYLHTTMETVINYHHLAESNMKETLRIHAKIHGPKSSRVLKVASRLASVNSSREAISSPEFLTALSSMHPG